MSQRLLTGSLDGGGFCFLAVADGECRNLPTALANFLSTLRRTSVDAVDKVGGVTGLAAPAAQATGTAPTA